MKTAHIYIFTISFFSAINLSAQEENLTIPQDSLIIKENYGLRLGVDLSKLLRSFLDDSYSGFEIKGDYRIYEDWYAAAEMGYNEFIYKENNFEGSTNGSYFKIGANFNTYNNWGGMQNEIFAGLRYGFANFTQELDEYTVYSHPYFPADVRDDNITFENLNASWAEFQLGTKVEVLKNLFLSLHVELKFQVHGTQPTNFDNLYIPGFNRTYDTNSIGVGYGYTISYFIPFYKL